MVQSTEKFHLWVFRIAGVEYDTNPSCFEINVSQPRFGCKLNCKGKNMVRYSDLA